LAFGRVVFADDFSTGGGGKSQIPNPKSQIPKKPQIPNPKKITNSKLQIPKQTHWARALPA
jgi:hypothetical protein